MDCPQDLVHIVSVVARALAETNHVDRERMQKAGPWVEVGVNVIDAPLIPRRKRVDYKKPAPLAPVRGRHDVYIAVIALASLAYVVLFSDTDVLMVAGKGMIVQITVWTAATVWIVRRNGNFLRFSEPAAIVLMFAFLYLIYPSMLWMRTGTLAFGVSMDLQTASSLFFLHALFLTGFSVAYVLAAAEALPRGDLVVAQWPTGHLLFATAICVFMIAVGVRVATGGGLIPNANYSEMWFEGQGNVLRSRSVGGGNYILAQLGSKTYMYPWIVQGVGGGLILARALRRGRGEMAATLLVALFAAAIAVLGSGARSPAVIVMLITFAFADFVAGPVPLRLTVPLIIVGALGFMFLGYFRAYRNLGVEEAIRVAHETFSDNSEVSNAGEFTGMLAKEAAVFEMFKDGPREGPTYFWRSVLDLLPSQVAPQKLSWVATSDLLSEKFLGTAMAAAGAGVAGTTIGDGYRSGGPIGVLSLGAVLGALLGCVQRWLTREFREKNTGSAFLKYALVAGYYGFTFCFVRSPLSEALMYLVYGLAVPYIVLSTVLRSPKSWLLATPVRSEPLRQG